MLSNYAIEILNLTKIYKIFNHPIDRVKESLNPFHKRYSVDFYALKDISFKVKKGETLGIIGKNGAGKSTLLKILTGVLVPSSGKINVHGRVASLLELGAGFNPEMTGLDNIYFYGNIMGYSKTEMDNKVSDIIEFADIGDFMYQPVKTYSSGMFARLAFAVNSNVEPDILIVDEALSVGDVFFQNKCFKKFEELEKKGVTILFVSHDISSVRRFCDRVLWLDQGCVLRLGNSLDVCDEYLKLQLQEMNKINDKAFVNNKCISSCKENIPHKNTLVSKVIFPKVTPKKIINNHPELGKLISFFITDVNDRRVIELYATKKYAFHIVGEFYENLNDVLFGVIIENNQGIQLTSFNTYISLRRGISVSKNTIVEHIIEFELPILMAGEYIVSPAIAYGTQENHVNIVWLPSFMSVYIINDVGMNVCMLEIPSHVKSNVYLPNDVSIEG